MTRGQDGRPARRGPEGGDRATATPELSLHNRPTSSRPSLSTRVGVTCLRRAAR